MILSVTQHFDYGKLDDEDLENLKQLLSGIADNYEYTSNYSSSDGPINQILYYDYDENETIKLKTSGKENTLNTSSNINEILKIINKYI